MDRFCFNPFILASAVYFEAYNTAEMLMSPNYEEYHNFPIINEDTKAVVMAFHGMNNYPKQFRRHFEELKKIVDIAIFAPKILDRGVNTLEKTGKDIYDKIDMTNIIKYNIPVFLLGISNGGRICLYIFDKFVSIHNYKNIYLSTLGSPLNGTYMANIALSFGALHNLVPNYYGKGFVLEELKSGSDVAKDLLHRCMSYDIFKTNTKFYAADQDNVVFPYTCSTINGYDNTHVSGCSHNGLMIKCSKDQVDWIFNILEKLGLYV